MDTGPLAALLLKRERYHEWVKAQWQAMEPRLFTCESVISEACFLMRRVSHGPELLMELVREAQIEIRFDLQSELDAVSGLMERYANVPMSLADACLVRMSELDNESVVFTLDSDFRRYRRNKRQVIPLIIPDDRK